MEKRWEAEIQRNKNLPSESLLLDKVRCSGCFPELTDGIDSLPFSLPFKPLEVDGEDLSRCLSRASLIRFRSAAPISTFDPQPPLSLYISPSSSIHSPRFSKNETAGNRFTIPFKKKIKGNPKIWRKRQIWCYVAPDFEKKEKKFGADGGKPEEDSRSLFLS